MYNLIRTTIYNKVTRKNGYIPWDLMGVELEHTLRNLERDAAANMGYNCTGSLYYIWYVS